MASLQDLFRRATHYLSPHSTHTSKQLLLSDGEIVYSKNNVCLHSIDRESNTLKHNLGYLTVKCHYNCNNSNNCNTFRINNNQFKEQSNDHKWTLCLEWTPNESLTQYLDNDSDYQYFNQNNQHLYSDYQQNCNSFDINFGNSLQSLNELSLNIRTKNEINICNKCDAICDEVCDVSLITNNNVNTTNSSHEYHENDNHFKRALSTSKCDISVTTTSPLRQIRRCQSCRTTPIKRNLSNKSSITTFRVDLKQMKSLRLFFGGDYCESHCDESMKSVESYSCDERTNGVRDGQLVIVSQENYYKVFHFHTGGLHKLSNVLNGWDFFEKCDSSSETNYLQFSICRPQLTTEECHPEEKLYVAINESQWKNCINECGQVINESHLRKTIFFAGIEPNKELRKQIWPFLLSRFEFNSTYAEREADVSLKREEYYKIGAKLESMAQKEKESFWRNVQSIVEKDVVRTDRSNPFFAGDNNDNIDKMKRILINFGLYCPSMGYTQGMSDLLAPLLSEIESEDQTFWCFVAMMRFTHFVCSPKDTDMDHNLALLRELLRLMFPLFYAHIRQFSEDLELLFTHRWILLCFKREFNESEALHIWESCWVRYETNYFHLFICLAIISVYGEDVIKHNMDSDEILFHFSTLSMHMNGNLILRKARGLFHQFCVLPQIPCTLKNLTNLSGLEMWDSNREQLIQCVKESQNTSHLCLCNTEPNN